jgi:hypothetical protein
MSEDSLRLTEHEGVIESVERGEFTIVEYRTGTRYSFHHSLFSQSTYQKLLTVSRDPSAYCVRVRFRCAGGRVTAVELI